MSLAPVDHTAGMFAGLISQFQGLPNIAAWTNALGAQLNDVDEFFLQLQNLNLQTATGVQLDIEGAALNQSRDGLTDDAYRTLLQARISANASNGNGEALIQILLTLAGSSFVQLIDGNAAPDISITALGINSPVTHSDIVAAMYQAKAAGVNMTLNAVTTLPAFAFDGPASSLVAGFDVGHLAGTFV